MIREKIRAFLYRFGSGGRRISLLREDGMDIGERCQIAANVSFGSEPYLITLGDDVKITNGVVFVTHDGGVHVLRTLGWLPGSDVFGTIKVGNNVFIGNKAAIMPGVTIGNNVVIGYGSIVTKDIPDNSVATGVPAHVIRTLDEYHDRLKGKAIKTKSMSPQDKKKAVLGFFGKK